MDSRLRGNEGLVLGHTSELTSAIKYQSSHQPLPALPLAMHTWQAAPELPLGDVALNQLHQLLAKIFTFKHADERFRRTLNSIAHGLVIFHLALFE